MDRINTEAIDSLLEPFFGYLQLRMYLSSPLADLDVPVKIGLGDAFDLTSGKVRQSPRWIQRSAFESLYCLIHEPLLLWRPLSQEQPDFRLTHLSLIEGIASLFR